MSGLSLGTCLPSLKSVALYLRKWRGGEEEGWKWRAWKKKCREGELFLFRPVNNNNNTVLARDSICYSALYAIARPSVCPSHGWMMDQSKTVEVRIMQLSPQSSLLTLVSSRLTSSRNSKGNLVSGGAK